MSSGCKGCSERTIDCHSNCARYEKFKEEMRIINKNRKQYFGYMRDISNTWSYIRSRKNKEN